MPMKPETRLAKCLLINSWSAYRLRLLDSRFWECWKRFLWCQCRLLGGFDRRS